MEFKPLNNLLTAVITSNRSEILTINLPKTGLENENKSFMFWTFYLGCLHHIVNTYLWQHPGPWFGQLISETSVGHSSWQNVRLGRQLFSSQSAFVHTLPLDLTWDQAQFSFCFVNTIPAGKAKQKESLIQIFYETSAAHFWKHSKTRKQW